jgi:hypothetical protein
MQIPERLSQAQSVQRTIRGVAFLARTQFMQICRQYL